MTVYQKILQAVAKLPNQVDISIQQHCYISFSKYNLYVCIPYTDKLVLASNVAISQQLYTLSDILSSAVFLALMELKISLITTIWSIFGVLLN